jgi:diguanylate cyclase (GGDEF)-like protein
MQEGQNTPALSLAVDNENPSMLDKLVRTLDATELMAMFSDSVWEELNLQSLSLLGTSGTIFERGRAARHSAEYALQIAQTNLGTLKISSRQRFAEADLMYLESRLGELIHPLKNCLEYQRAMNMAMLDELTGVGNRRAFDQRLIKSCALAQRHLQPLCLAVIDIDHFKQLNDTYGHLAGDQVLRQLSHCLQECARSSDEVFRYGGEEFIILLPQTSITGASRFVERCREAISEMNIKYDGEAIQCKVSAGIAELQRSEVPTTLLKRADSALYAAKQTGRNCVRAS